MSSPLRNRSVRKGQRREDNNLLVEMLCKAAIGARQTTSVLLLGIPKIALSISRYDVENEVKLR